MPQISQIAAPTEEPTLRLSLPNVSFGPFTRPANDEAKEDLLLGEACFSKAILLPSSAELEVRLHDISLADAKPATLAKCRIKPAAKSPVPFAIPYRETDIKAGRVYAISGTIRAAGELLLANACTQLVFTDSPAARVKLQLIPVR